MRKYFTLLLINIFLFSGFISGQDVISMKSKTKGFSVGLHGGILAYSADDIHATSEIGYGFGGQIQYGFSHRVAAALSFQHYSVTSESINSTSSPYPYTEFDLLARFNLGSTDSRFRSHFALGGNYTRSEESFYYEDPNTFEIFYTTETYSGYSFCAGTGINYFFTPQLSLDLSAFINTGSYESVIINGFDYDQSFAFFSYKGIAGLTYHF